MNVVVEPSPVKISSDHEEEIGFDTGFNESLTTETEQYTMLDSSSSKVGNEETDDAFAALAQMDVHEPIPEKLGAGVDNLELGEVVKVTRKNKKKEGDS